jgi:hypothetical protein
MTDPIGKDTRMTAIQSDTGVTGTLTIADVVAALLRMPQDAPPVLHYDGGAFTMDAIWLSRSGNVHFAGLGDMVDEKDRIVGAPAKDEQRYLIVHEMLGVPAPRDPYDID